MILVPVSSASEACTICIDGGLPNRAGEEMQMKPGLKGRLYALKTFVISSLMNIGKRRWTENRKKASNLVV